MTSLPSSQIDSTAHPCTSGELPATIAPTCAHKCQECAYSPCVAMFLSKRLARIAQDQRSQVGQVDSKHLILNRLAIPLINKPKRNDRAAGQADRSGQAVRAAAPTGQDAAAQINPPTISPRATAQRETPVPPYLSGLRQKEEEAEGMPHETKKEVVSISICSYPYTLTSLLEESPHFPRFASLFRILFHVVTRISNFFYRYFYRKCLCATWNINYKYSFCNVICCIFFKTAFI